MGRSGDVTRAVFAKAKAQRDRHASRHRPQGGDAAAHVAAVVEPVVAPAPAAAAFLVENAAVASRLPGAADALRMHMRSLAAETRKRGRDDAPVRETLEGVMAALAPELPTLIADECGVRVLCELLRAAATLGAATEDAAADAGVAAGFAETIYGAIEQFGAAAEAPEGDDGDSRGVAGLAVHHVGRQLVWAVIEHGGDALRKRINKVLAARTLRLVGHRHGSIALSRLLEFYPKSARTVVPALLEGGALPAYIEDPVSAAVIVRLATPKHAAAIIEAAAASEGGIWGLAQSKRGMRLLTQLAEEGLAPACADAEKRDAAVAAAATLLDGIKATLPEQTLDERGNFLVQAVARAVDAANDAAGAETLVAGVTKATATVPELCLHGIGAHVASMLASLPGPVGQRAVEVLRPHFAQLSNNQHGSLALRRMVEAPEATPAQRQAAAETLSRTLAPRLAALIEDEFGNLVVQALLRALPTAAATQLFAKFVRPNLLQLCQHQYAAHVVYAALDAGVLEAKAQHEVVTALRAHVLPLAKHVNGRFVVERLVAPHREVREVLLGAFEDLACSKGSHPVLQKLYDSSEARTRQAIATIVGTRLDQLATNQNASLVLQRMLQSDKSAVAATATDAASTSERRPEILTAVRKALGLDAATGDATASSSPLQQRLRNDFFGRFVVMHAGPGDVQAPPQGARPSNRPPSQHGGHHQQQHGGNRRPYNGSHNGNYGAGRQQRH